jgi:hypothetical protein
LHTLSLSKKLKLPKKLKADRNKLIFFFFFAFPRRGKKISFLTRYTLSDWAEKIQNQQDIKRIKFRHGIILVVTDCNHIFIFKVEYFKSSRVL